MVGHTVRLEGGGETDPRTRKDPTMKLTITAFVSLGGVMQSPGMPDEDPKGLEAAGGEVGVV